MRLTKEAYGWDPDAQFLVPDEVLAHFAGDRRRARRQGRGRVGASAPRPTAPSTPSCGTSCRSSWRGALPDGWDAEVPKFRPEDGMIATRKASQR